MKPPRDWLAAGIPAARRRRGGKLQTTVRIPAEPCAFAPSSFRICHLGTPGCQAGALLDFLRRTESDYLFLVGDIIDGWQLKRRWYWHQLHNDVVQKVLRKARKGTEVVYVPGNHDEAARHYVGVDFGGIAIRDEATHVTADGHATAGHARRPLRRRRHVREVAGASGRPALHAHAEAQPALQRLRARVGLPYWSLSRFLKLRVKNAVAYIGAFEDALAREARTRGFDGVVCGHIHHAEVRRIGDILYCNSGDWVESLTALVEADDGTLSVLRWHETLAAGRPAAARGTVGRAHIRDERVTNMELEAGPTITGAPPEPMRTRVDRSLRILIVSDAWSPQINGVVVTLGNTIRELQRMGQRWRRSRPTDSARYPVRPTPRSGCRCSRGQRWRGRIEAFAPDAMHIATEGPLGLAARRHALRTRQAVHDRVSHAVPGVRSCALPAAAGDQLPVDALVPRPGRGTDGRDAGHRAAARRPRLRQSRSLVARRRHGALSPRTARATGRAAADLRVRRARGGRKEPRGLPVARPARHQVGRRGRTGARGPAAAISRVRSTSA